MFMTIIRYIYLSIQCVAIYNRSIIPSSDSDHLTVGRRDVGTKRVRTVDVQDSAFFGLVLQINQLILCD